MTPNNIYVINQLKGELPVWFVTKFQPCLELISSYKIKKEEQLKLHLGAKNPSVAEYMKVDKIISETMLAERSKSICHLFIRTIEEFENNRWPTDFFSFRQESLYKCMIAIEIYCKNISIVDVSNQLADSLVCESKAIFWSHQIQDLVRFNIIRNRKCADFLSIILFQELCLERYSTSFKIICDWIMKDWIDVEKYEPYIKSFIGKKYICHSNNADSDRRYLLTLLRKSPMLYKRMVNLFDAEIKRFNIQGFNSYKMYGGNDPSDFKAYPFADGSCMRPVKSWFSWKLE